MEKEGGKIKGPQISYGKGTKNLLIRRLYYRIVNIIKATNTKNADENDLLL